MTDYPDTIQRAFHLFFAFVLIAATFVLLSVLIFGGPDPQRAEAQTTSAKSRAPSLANDPNIITGGMSVLAYEINQTVASTERVLAESTQTIASTATNGVSTIAKGAATVAGGIQAGAIATARFVANGTASVGRTIGSGVMYVLGIPGDVIGFVTNTQIVSSYIRPADHIEDVPIIDPDSPELLAALNALPATEKQSKKPSGKNSGPRWPMRGAITTHFGVDHWPYQHKHSGMDISDGNSPGVTPIKPFRPGKVVDTISSAYGLGNHVIVDHGNGVTSVYAHLASITVRAGQQVDTSTTIGYEGSTGASTGTHLHFEIRVNGKATNPRQFITGQP